MKIFNTLTNSYFELNKKDLNIYVCGPTVYDHIHIGNARPILLTDTLIRFLEYKNYKINFLQNITDVDDKIILKSIEMNKSEKELADIYIESYLQVLAKLKIRMPNKIIPISTKIPLMQGFIDELISMKSAYEKNGDVLFSIKKYASEYGKLSNNKIENLISKQAENSITKQNTIDFSLWKKTTLGVNWKFREGEGRPGWHTECVALIDEYFNHQTIDIHIGGIDLQFPHHENERIQFIAKNKSELSNVWMHNGHLTINNVKMSKSLNNTTYLKDFINDFEVNSLKWIFLTNHYKQPINISNELILQSQKFIEKINNLIKKIKLLILKNEINFCNDIFDQEKVSEFEYFMMDDLNTSQVLTLIEDMITNLNKNSDFGKINRLYNSLRKIILILGFDFNFSLDVDSEMVNIFKKHQKLLKEKKFDEADKLRDVLIKGGLM